MSTKVSIFYDEKEDVHFYFDWKDMKCHLLWGGREVELPESFKKFVKELSDFAQAFDFLFLQFSFVKQMHAQLKEWEIEKEEGEEDGEAVKAGEKEENSWETKLAFGLAELFKKHRFKIKRRTVDKKKLQELIKKIEKEIEWSKYWLKKARETLDDLSEAYFEGHIEGISRILEWLKKVVE